MADEQPNYTPTTIEKVFELLDTKLVSLGVPTALGAAGINSIRTGNWQQAVGYFAGAAAVWVAIKVGKRLAPELDHLLDWIVKTVKATARSIWTQLDFTGQFLRQQAQLNEEFITEGYSPDVTIPLLEEVFVPLELSGTIDPERLAQPPHRQDPSLYAENLTIWELLQRSQQNRSYRQMVIQAKGGMGKTTLLRHIALIYGQRKQRRYHAAKINSERVYGVLADQCPSMELDLNEVSRVSAPRIFEFTIAGYHGPKLVPILLRLRDWAETLTQADRLSLAKLITEHQIPKLWDGQDRPPTPPDQWAATLLKQGKALVLFDGFDEVPEAKRAQVSAWLSHQMEQYSQSVFILTSRPAGYKDYTAKKPAIPLFVKKFTPAQQESFIRRWYVCQEKCYRLRRRQQRQAKTVAKKRADDLIAQLQARRQDLGYMAENPLLLNMLVTFHRSASDQELPRQRLELYRNICRLQLEDRPRARSIRMPLSYPNSEALLQQMAWSLVKAKRFTVPKPALLKFLAQQPLLSEAEIAPQDWLTPIVEVSELLVEREPGEYEFPHASFQGFFAATRLAKPEDKPTIQNNAQLILDHWNEAVWRETVLLYTAQLNPKLLNGVIRKACEQGSEAAALAADCLKEYPRPDKIQDDLKGLLDDLEDVAQDSKYQKLEELLKAGQWRDADQETYRLMITTVGKEDGQWFDKEDLLNFPCEDLLAIDGLWVNYSQGKFGFSVQKQIYVDCGAKLDGEYPGDKIWYKFCDRVGWRKGGNYLNYRDLKANPSLSPTGEFPRAVRWPVSVGVVWDALCVFYGVVVSSLASRLVNCSR